MTQPEHLMAALHYDSERVAAMLAELIRCPPEQQMDTLAVVVKVFVEDRIPRSTR